ncbi:MAG TPA: cation:proton antiporter [Terriglobales bacterium]|nr:cation:proton antiporter [Terriglobales bacterium]
MTSSQLGSAILPLALLIATVHILGYLFTRLRQPRVIGEIAAGVLFGPALLGWAFPAWRSAVFGSTGHPERGVVLEFVYWMGLLFLMFASGAETRHLFSKEDRRQVSWLASIGTGLPFVITLAVLPFFPVDGLMGAAHQRTALCLVIGIAVAVTSIPVISKIFFDLKILHTRFARLVLGVAVIEDILLWAVLAIATALAKSNVVPKHEIAAHVAVTMFYFGAGLTLLPRLLRSLARARWNLLATASPVGYLVAVLFTYTALAAVMDVNLVFAAFLAGFAIASERERFEEPLQSLNQFSFAVFVAPYFAIVGYKLDLTRSLSLWGLAVFVAIACVVKLIAVACGARLAGFRGLDVINLAVATNARGGPGIVLASVALDAGIVNATFYTTLVLLAVLTSQAAGAWLDLVLRRGWSLLSGGPNPTSVANDDRPETAAA